MPAVKKVFLRAYAGEGIRRGDVEPDAQQTLPQLAWCIDDTLFDLDAMRIMIEHLCREAARRCFADVCVKPRFVLRCSRLLQGSGVGFFAVMDFPMGANDIKIFFFREDCCWLLSTQVMPTEYEHFGHNGLSINRLGIYSSQQQSWRNKTEIMALEARRCVQLGAIGIDIVLAICALKGGDHAVAFLELSGCSRQAVGLVLLKLSIECSLLDNAQKKIACRFSLDGGADIVQISSGFSSCGTTLEGVALMRRHRQQSNQRYGLRRDQRPSDTTARAMLAAGVYQLGTSRGATIFASAGTGACDEVG